MEFRPFWDVLADLGIDLPDASRIRTSETGLAPKRSLSKDCWFPSGEMVEVSGYEISGMVYCGESLMSVNRSSNFEPSLIHPGLRTECKQPDYAGKMLPLNLSYAQMTAANRAAYLEWLANGRRDLEIGSGYVRLFFYGLERRVFHDLPKLTIEKYPQKLDELRQIAEEARQLNQRYPSSFGRNIDHLIEACELQLSEFEAIAVEPTNPFYVRVGLGQLIQQDQAIPEDWAFAYCEMISKSLETTLIKRFPEVFRELFRVRYRQYFWKGIHIKNDQSTWRVSYYPSSASFGGQTVTLQVKNLPNLYELADQFEKVNVVLEHCQKDLALLSRLVIRNPELRYSPTAIAPFPPELWHLSPNLTKLEQSLQQRFQKTTIVLLTGETLLKDWQSSNPDKLTQAETKSLVAFLEQCGYGVEPDLKSVNRKSFLALYQVQSGEITQHYKISSLAIHICVATLIQEKISIDQIKTEIDAFFSLSPAEKIRIEAYFTWLLTQSPSLRNLKARIQKIEPEQRTAIAAFLIAIATKNPIHPKLVQQLEKAYTLLGLDAKSVYSDIHDRTTSDDPVTIRKASPSRDFTIPKSEPLMLNRSLIESKMVESQEISGLLAEIFVEEQEPEKVTIADLDAPHSEFLRAIAVQEIWQREELEAIAAKLNLMLDGALEVINESAFDLCDEAVIEGDNTLEVNREVLEEILR